MKYLLLIILFFTVVSCGTDIENVDPTDPITEETKEQMEDLQEDNVEIEMLDGQLDSLLNEIE